MSPTRLDKLGAWYFGRGLFIGATHESTIVGYFITGRSQSSLNRRLEFDEETKVMRVVESKEGGATDDRRENYLYEALFVGNGGIAVGNGAQVKTVYEVSQKCTNLLDLMSKAQGQWSYETDSRHTPRISGFVDNNQTAVIGVIRKGTGGEPLRECWQFLPQLGGFKLIATYSDPDDRLEKPFEGGPIEICLDGQTPSELAEEVYAQLGPRNGGRDLRVAVAVFSRNNSTGEITRQIINRK